MEANSEVSEVSEPKIAKVSSGPALRETLPNLGSEGSEGSETLRAEQMTDPDDEAPTLARDSLGWRALEAMQDISVPCGHSAVSLKLRIEPGPARQALEQLRRAGWVIRDSAGHYALTPAGLALLGAP